MMTLLTAPPRLCVSSSIMSDSYQTVSSLGQELCLIYVYIWVPGIQNRLNKDLLNERKNEWVGGYGSGWRWGTDRRTLTL